ncbi:MAG: alanine racemase [Anaerolineaceae bacterium]|nr:alanine racemase [Anaerolineaceae bacterium]
MTLKNFGTWLEIDLSTLRNNYRLLGEISGSQVMPVIKANAYGHGLERVATALEDCGAEWFGVARIEEALMLRELGIKAKILVLGYTAPTRVSHAIKEKISLTVYDFSIAETYASQAQDLQETVNLHVKIDTGMGRLGIRAEEAAHFVQYVKDQKSLTLEGVFTHFACADEPEKDVTAKQIRQFEMILRELESENLLPEVIHAANSAGTINFPETRFNLIRAGIALYGHPPSSQTKLPDGIVSAISWKTRLISIKELPPGHGISYGHTYHTKSKERIGVIAVGYGDGLRRRPGNFVLIHGKRVPIIGNVCMDQCMVILDGVPDASIGDEVVIIGKQGNEEISATDIANDWGTINYEVLCGLAARMPRHYLKTK